MGPFSVSFPAAARVRGRKATCFACCVLDCALFVFLLGRVFAVVR